MRRRFAIAIFLALSACVVVGPPVLVYVPADAFGGPGGGCPAHYQAQLFERDGVALVFLLDPRVRAFGRLRLDIPEGRTATFLDSRIAIANPSSSKSLAAELSPACIDPLYNPAHKECFFGLPVSDEGDLFLTLPPLEINGSRYDLKPMRFSLKEVLPVCWSK